METVTQYQHRFTDGKPCLLQPGKVVCVGRNYADHIAELSNAVPKEPLLFIKANNSLTPFHDVIHIPVTGECHNELELAFLLGKPLRNADISQVYNAIAGVGLALDLTLRDKQSELKANGHPWERAKAFDGSCPVSEFMSVSADTLNAAFQFQLEVNGHCRQQGDSSNMLWQWPELLAHVSQTFTLFPGDIVLTGTPKGVGPLVSGDQIKASLHNMLTCEATVKQGSTL